jgi:hypothetical protein
MASFKLPVASTRPTAPGVERRRAARIDKVFRVLLCTEATGEQWYVARNISVSGMFVEMPSPIPLREKVIVRFEDPGGVPLPSPGVRGVAPPSICAMARVQNHYYLQYSDESGLRALSGVGLRFLRFMPEAGGTPPRRQLH